MIKNKLRANPLGEQTAENDKNLLTSSFIETPEYRSLLESRDSTVVVGRRGTGKSAMYLKLADFWGAEKNNHVIKIAPEDYQTIGFRGLFKLFNNKYSHVRAASRLFWKYGILVEMLSYLSKNYKIKDEFSLHGRSVEHTKAWVSNSSDFLSKLTRRISQLLKTNNDIETLISSINIDLEISELENDLHDLLQLSKINFYLLLDRLDEGYENDETGAAIIAGLIAVVAEYNKKFLSVRPVLFQRDNIIRAVAKYDPDYTRNIESELIRIHWDTHQLLNLVAKRLNNCFNLNLENSQRIWDRCTADAGNGNELQGNLGFKKVLQFTLYRPRDLLSLLNQSFYLAAREDRDTIVLSDIEKTAKSISETRLDDLIKEYKSIIPSIAPAVTVFANGSPELTYHDAISLLDNISIKNKSDISTEMDYAILGSDGIIKALYSIGFIGTHDESSGSFNFCHDGRSPDLEFNLNDKILIHPCYWIGLNLSRNALSPDEAEQINDEYEIKITSVTPEIRAQKIGTLISEIGNIEEGKDGAYDFEEWVLKALQTIFAGNLGNIEIHPNGASVQRRDIVGTNLKKSSFWSYIGDAYGVRQVVFDAKNYQGMKSSEYRQLSTYLTGSYGRLGFIITRDPDESIRAGSELDWVREIYYSQQKLIIRISFKILVRILGKLRNPDKHDVVENSLNSMLDKYERTYLSLPSTRSSKK